MSLQEEPYADARASQVRQTFHPYVRERIRSRNRLTAISEVRRFFILLLGAHGCICASAGYLYNLFSGNLQQKYNYTQTEMSTITTVASIIGLVAFPLASVYDYYGPRPLFFVGLVAYPLGSILFALSFMDLIKGSVFRFTIYCSLQGIGTSMFDISSLMTVMTIFPSSRGAVIAVMKTFIGLGSAIFGICQVGFFEEDISMFFFFLSAYVCVVGLLCFAFVALPPYHLNGYEEKHLSLTEKFERISQKRAYLEQIPPLKRFAVGFIIVILLIILLPTESALVAFAHLDHQYKKVFAITTIGIVCLYSFIAAPIPWLDYTSNNEYVEVQHTYDANIERVPGCVRDTQPVINAEQHRSTISYNFHHTEEKAEIEHVENKASSNSKNRESAMLEKQPPTNEQETVKTNSKKEQERRKIGNNITSITVESQQEEELEEEEEEEQALLETCEVPSLAQVARESAILSYYIANTRGSIADEAVFTMPFIDEAEHIAPQYQTTFIESLRTLELWVLAYSMFCIVGAQVVIIVNARFIYAAIAEKPISNEIGALLTILNGAGSAVARLLMSVFEIWTQKREPEKRIPLTIALYIPSLCMLLASASILIIPPAALIVPFVLTAFGNGFYAACTVLVMRTIYAKDMANHYNFLSIASLLATILLNKMLYGYWYTWHAKQQNDTLCKGRRCIYAPFVVITALQLTTLISNWFVHIRYRGFCEQSLLRRGDIPTRASPLNSNRLPSNQNETQYLLQ